MSITITNPIPQDKTATTTKTTTVYLFPIEKTTQIFLRGPEQEKSEKGSMKWWELLLVGSFCIFLIIGSVVLIQFKLSHRSKVQQENHQFDDLKHASEAQEDRTHPLSSTPVMETTALNTLIGAEPALEGELEFSVHVPEDADAMSASLPSDDYGHAKKKEDIVHEDSDANPVVREDGAHLLYLLAIEEIDLIFEVEKVDADDTQSAEFHNGTPSAMLSALPTIEDFEVHVAVRQEEDVILSRLFSAPKKKRGDPIDDLENAPAAPMVDARLLLSGSVLETRASKSLEYTALGSGIYARFPVQKGEDDTRSAHFACAAKAEDDVIKVSKLETSVPIAALGSTKTLGMIEAEDVDEHEVSSSTASWLTEDDMGFIIPPPATTPPEATIEDIEIICPVPPEQDDQEDFTPSERSLNSEIEDSLLEFIAAALEAVDIQELLDALNITPSQRSHNIENADSLLEFIEAALEAVDIQDVLDALKIKRVLPPQRHSYL